MAEALITVAIVLLTLCALAVGAEAEVILAHDSLIGKAALEHGLPATACGLF
jgi:hypothetical protein